MENNNPKKSKAFIIAFILILLLLLGGYYLFTNRATIFNTKGVVTMQKIFAPLLGSSKNKDLSVIGGTDTSSTSGKTITGVITTDQNGNKVIQAEAGEDIKKGDVLYISSFNKNNAPIVMRAIANDKSKSLVFGVAGQDMNKGTMGNVIIEGILSGVPTNRTEVTNWAPKNPLYLSDKIYGGMTKNPPYAPSFVIPVGSVISIDAINGSIRIGGILNDANITADNKTNLNNLNGDLLNNSNSGIRNYYDSVFGISNNNKGTVINNNGFILNPITIPGSSSFSSNLPTVTAVASPASIVAGGSSIISWISTKATICNAGPGNGTETTGSFKTGVLTKSKSFTISCTGANGSKSSGNTFVAVIVPSVCINKATNPPECTTINGACINKATNPPLCTDSSIACTNKATNPPLCTTIDGVCINNANNYPTCTTTDNTCPNGSTDYPVCKNILSLFPSVKVTAKPASVKKGGTTVISWTSTKTVSCDAGNGNGIGKTGSFKTGVLTTDTSYSVVCVDAKGSKGSGNVYVTVIPNISTKPECSDGIDNNNNGLIDEKDPNCHVGGILTGKYLPNHYSESDPPFSANPQCSDDIDNNNNGLIDFQDPNCHIGGVITGEYKPKHYSEDTPPYNTSTWPSIKLKATPISINVGGTSNISWTSTNTTSCNAGIGTSNGTTGSFITEALSESRSYTVTCKGDQGEVSSDVFVNVFDAYKLPSVTVTATPPSVDSGGSSKISWTSTNTTSCAAGTGRGAGTTGSFDTGALIKTTSYTVVCIGPNGQKGGNTSVSINGGVSGTGKPECSDGIDNNGNGLIDINEPNCHINGDLNKEYIPDNPSESIFPTECSDGIDNNGNGLIDKNDPSCHVGGDLKKEYLPKWTSESTPPTQCNDGVDNDGDGLIDVADPGCHIDGDMTKEYVPTWNSEKNSPVSPYENTCKVIDSNPLVFTDVEKAQLDELLRKFYLIAPSLRTEDDINIAYSEITQYQNFSEHLKTLINQCYKQTSDPAYIAAGGPTTRFGNPWYHYSTSRGSYIDKTFDCKYVSGWFSGNGADGKNCDTYNQKIYALKTASCSGSISLNNPSSNSGLFSHSDLYNTEMAARQGNVKAQQDLIYADGLKNKCIWNPGAKIADLEKIFNVW